MHVKRMRTLVYKRTHSGDPDPASGVFGNNNCTRSVRGWNFDAVIGIGAWVASRADMGSRQADLGRHRPAQDRATRDVDTSRSTTSSTTVRRSSFARSRLGARAPRVQPKRPRHHGLAPRSRNELRPPAFFAPPRRPPHHRPAHAVATVSRQLVARPSVDPLIKVAMLRIGIDTGSGGIHGTVSRWLLRVHPDPGRPTRR